jgi:glycosyltransferase involved in cell wall biosynthesis
MVFIENYVGGGSDRHLIDIVNALKDEFKGIVIVSNPPGLFRHDLIRLQKKVETLPIQIITQVRLFDKILKNPSRLVRTVIRCALLPLQPIILLYNLFLCIFWLRILKPSVVLGCNGGYPAARMTLLMIMVAKFLRIKTVLSIVSMPSPRKKLFIIYDQILDKLVWMASDIVMVNAYAIAYSLQILRDMPKDKVVVIHNALEDKQLLVKREKIIKKECIIGFLGRMEYEKGVILLLETFAKLAKKYKHIKMVMVGSGNATGQLTKLVDDHRLKEKIDIVGYYEGEVNDLLTKFDIYAFSSFNEGLPYSVLEAMRAGCAIVSTSVGGIPEVIRNGVDGLLVAPGSIDELEKAIETLINDNNLRVSLGKNARERFLNMCTLEIMNGRMKELFKTAISD